MDQIYPTVKKPSVGSVYVQKALGKEYYCTTVIAKAVTPSVLHTHRHKYREKTSTGCSRSQEATQNLAEYANVTISRYRNGGEWVAKPRRSTRLVFLTKLSYSTNDFLWEGNLYPYIGTNTELGVSIQESSHLRTELPTEMSFRGVTTSQRAQGWT